MPHAFPLELLNLPEKKDIKLIRRKYQSRDLQGIGLVIGATDDRGLNKKISREAKKRKILVNIVDDPGLCSFIVPSIIKRGPLVVAISTSAQAPALAKALRLKLEGDITPQLGRLTTELGKIRRKKLAASSARTKS